MSESQTDSKFPRVRISLKAALCVTAVVCAFFAGKRSERNRADRAESLAVYRANHFVKAIRSFERESRLVHERSSEHLNLLRKSNSDLRARLAECQEEKKRGYSEGK